MLAALISALSSATELVVDKIALARERISLRVFLPTGFILIAALALILVPAFGRIDVQIALLPNTLFLLFMLIVLAIASNVLIYQSIQREKIHHHELMMMMAPIITVILAAIFYPEEYNQTIFVLALVAGAALLFAKSSKEHFFIDRTSYNTFLAVILLSSESIVTRELLFSFTPVALYAIRTIILAIFFTIYYRPSFERVSFKHWWIMLGSAALGLVQMLAKYYAFSSVGLIYTTLITMLGPIIVFIASWEILHEKIRPRVIIAAAVILACITWATLIINAK